MQTRSPIRQSPLPQAGQSSQSIMEDRWFDRVVMPLIVTSIVGVLAAMDWLELFLKHSPWIWTGLFLVCLIFTIRRYRSMLPEIRQRTQGIQGERVTGEWLENLRALGCNIYHDIAQDVFNIDHAIIGPYGIFAIETKTPSKPAKGSPLVEFHGETVTINAFTPERDPIAQTKAAADRLRKILLGCTGREVKVTPVLLFVDWYVESYSRDNSIEVRNQQYFFKSFDRLHDPNILTQDDVNFLSRNFERYLREKKS